MSAIWNGVFKHIAEVPSVGDGFAGERWRKSCYSRFQSKKKQLEYALKTSSNQAHSGTPLSMLLATIVAEQERASVLDYGGGFGENYLSTKACLSDRKWLDYHILEVPEVCEAGREALGAGGPKFIESLSESERVYDVVYFGSSLHYIEDWCGTIEKCAALAKQYLFFVDLPAGNIPTFATAQTYYESQIPVWFFSFSDVVNQVKNAGFGLTWRSVFEGRIKGQLQPLPLDNLPEEYRLDYSCNLLFKRERE